MVGSTFRLLPAAKVLAKFLPLDTISLRYVAWEVLVEVGGLQRAKFSWHALRWNFRSLVSSYCQCSSWWSQSHLLAADMGRPGMWAGQGAC